MHYVTYLRLGVITGLFATLVVPFIVADGQWMAGLFFPYITGKNFIFRILVELTLALYVILAIRDPKYRPRASWLMWAIVGLVGWMAIATVTSVDPIKSFWSNFERMEGYVTLLHLFAYFVIAGAVLTAHNLWERFFNTSIGLSVYMGVYALAQALGWFGLHPSSQSGARADTSFGNATYLAVYMLFNFFLTLFMLARAAERGRLGGFQQSLYGIALVLQFTGLYLTQTRGALLGCIGGLVVAMIWLVIRWLMARGQGSYQWQTLGRWSLGGLVALAIVGGVFFAFREQLKSQGGTIGRLASISFEEKTTRSRLFSIWPIAIEGAKERPITGWGQENFSYVFNKHYTPSMWDQEQWFDRAHNQFLDWLVAGGVPAFLFYLAMFACAVWAIIRSGKLSAPEQAVLLGLLAGYAFNNLLVFDNLVSAMYFMAILAFVHGLVKRELPGNVWLSRPVGDHGVAIAAPIVGLVVLVGAWALNAPGFARASTLSHTFAVAQDPAAAAAEYKKALGSVWPGSGLGYQEVVEQLVNYSSNNIANGQVDQRVKENFYMLSLDAAKKLMAQREGDARLELFVSGLYAQFGQYKEAIAHAQEALKLSPGKQQILIQLGLTYLSANDTERAVAAFKQAYEEATENNDALLYLAVGYYAHGDTGTADRILTERYGSAVVDDDRLIRIFTNLKMHSRAIAIWKLRVEKNPKDQNTLLGLASAYFAAGDKANTISTLRQVAQLNPASAGQIQEIITQIESGVLKLGQ